MNFDLTRFGHFRQFQATLFFTNLAKIEEKEEDLHPCFLVMGTPTVNANALTLVDIVRPVRSERKSKLTKSMGGHST